MLPSSILRNKLDSRNARLMQAVDPDHLIEEAEERVKARELEVTASQIPSYDRVRPCKLVELGYSPHLSRRGTVPKPPKPEELRDLISPPAKNLFSADTVTPPLAPGDAGRGVQAQARG
eukprot:CAMPEP_0198454840 /NCGR_PEP_ID=MMETSP1453-20131121/15871_1 /TAXON_ID=1461543 ORGANISM="Unidentified sp., Strain RCC701" /NCGR_SAMPLE_ID=MMETSP1453 /ASSEMBLY_ACC=CAM_ASM_001118 /LENGTH=118 /DNA_ID=CAMNT_0044179027 /DNA_START=18 /DNA_END=370 /DNA_ORIENTATION=-